VQREIQVLKEFRVQRETQVLKEFRVLRETPVQQVHKVLPEKMVVEMFILRGNRLKYQGKIISLKESNLFYKSLLMMALLLVYY